VIAVDACLFIDGAHVRSARNCPHVGDVVDQEGLVPVRGWTVQQGPASLLPGNVVTVDELPHLDALRQDPYVDVDQHLAHLVIAADEDERVAIRTGRASDVQEGKISGAGDTSVPDSDGDHDGTAGEVSPEASEAAPDAPANNPSTDEAPASE
jgi:hypothetical protein